MRSDKLLLEDILERTEKIIANSDRFSREEIEADSNVYEANLRHIEIIGEAVKMLPQSFKDAHPEIPWRQIGRTRDILSHIYFAVSSDRIWNIVSVEIPKLREAVLAMLASPDLGSTNPPPE